MNELDIFSAALEVETSDARKKYLDEACGDNADLRDRIEALLRSARQVGSFLEHPATEVAATIEHSVSERPGAQIGPYKLLQQIGEGGMGAVFMAEQTEPVQRRVALKIIKPGMDSRQVIARFEAERQALALMDHPNIAKVLDAATTDSGRPYFVMELVKGVPITRYCDEQHSTPKQRLELLISVCQAVQHAHQKGVIHRDLKPSNVLVALYDGHAVPKVIDFGVAKATTQKLTEKTMFTELGQVVGTLEYMSPEQAQLNQLDIDTRSDIYSLGVLLYELLTGVTPFDRKRLQSAAFDEMLRIIREEEPPRPSMRLSTIDTLPSVAANRSVEPRRLRNLFRGELDWIVMKSMEKDRGRRYETANNLAADIQRYLDDERVEACPPSVSYRFRKFARRNKAALATAVVITVALLLGFLGTTWQWLQAEQARAGEVKEAQRAVAALAGEARQRRLAEIASTKAESSAELATVRAKRANEERDRATVTRLAAESRALQGERPNLSVLLAIEAIELSRQHNDSAFPIAHEALLNASQRLRGRQLVGHAGKIRAMTMSSDWLATIAEDTAQLWDLTAEDPASSSRVLGAEGERITCMALSEDGDWLVTGGSKLQRWDLTARNPDLSPMALIAGVPIISLGLSPDGRWLVAQSAEGTGRLWDLDAPDPTASRIFARPSEPFRWPIAVSPDGRWVATGTKWVIGPQPPGARLWDLTVDGPSLSPIVLLERGGWVGAMEISRDGRWLATGSRDGTARLWDLKSKNLETSPHVIKASDRGLVPHVVITPNSRWLFTTASHSPRILRWDLSAADPTSLPLVLRGHKDSVTSLAASNDGRWLVSGSLDGTARLWDLAAADPSSSAVVLKGHDTSVWPWPQVAIHPHGRWIVTADHDGTARLWDLQVANPASSPFVLRGHEDGIFSATAISSDGRWIATSLKDNTVQLWDLQARDPSMFSRVLRGPKDSITSVEISPNDRWLVAGSRDSTTRVWDLKNQAVASSSIELGTRSTGDKDAGKVAIDPTSRWLASAGADHKVRLWDLNADDPAAAPRILSGHKATVTSMTMSPDGRWLVTGGGKGDHTVRLWNLRAQDPQVSSQELSGHTMGISSLAIDRNSRWLVSGGGERQAIVWDLKSIDPAASRRVIPWPGKGGIWQLAISPNGRWLLTTRHDHTAQLWDLSRSDPTPYELRGHDGFQCVAISPDGRWLATGTRVNAQLWDLTARDPTTTARFLRGHEEAIWSVRISADSRWLVTDASDGTIRRWSLDTNWLLNHARKVAGRELTNEEREHYLER